MWEDIDRDRKWNAAQERRDRMKPPDVVPDAVIDSIAESCLMDSEEPSRQRPDEFQRRLRELRWSMDHYFYYYAGMYVGVELDGYMHT